MIPEGIVDKYEIVKTLQESAATAVLLVRHRQLGELRILKSVSKDNPISPFILSEAKILSGYRHPGIPTIYDVEETDSLIYIVEEYVQGQSLHEYLLHRKNLTRKEIAKICIAVCEVINTLHTQEEDPVIYRDIKPEHVIVTRDGIKVIDYGIATNEQHSSSGNAGYGTKSYASPEQLKGLKTDVRSDIYGIGKLMLYMLEYAEPKERQGISAIARKAASEKPEDRFQTVREMMNQLEVMNRLKPCDQKEKRHLLNKIAVVGASQSCGCTHIAIAITVFLNSRGVKAYYCDRSRENLVQKMARVNPLMKKEDGVLYHDNFCGILNYGGAVENSSPPQGLIIEDMGTREPDFNADYVFYIVSTRAWQQPEVTPYNLGQCHWTVISNFTDKGLALGFAKKTGKRVYTYPLQSNPFMECNEVDQLLERIFKEEVNLDLENKKREGILSKNYSHYRCTKRDGSNSFWPFDSKLSILGRG